MKDIFVEFGEMFLIRSEAKEGFSISITVPVETIDQDYSCTVIFNSNESKSQMIFGMNSGDCLKLALIYIENILSYPSKHLGGEVFASDGGKELPIICVKK